MVIILVIIALMLTIYVVLPLYRNNAPRQMRAESDGEIDRLRRQKDKLYNDIRDLDFEYGIGKMAEMDYKYLRGEAIKEVAAVIEKIESMPGKKSGNGHVPDEVIEQWILDQRQITGRTELKACPSCHEKTIATARFCMHCGGPLK